jgi:copper resistance protein C
MPTPSLAAREWRFPRARRCAGLIALAILYLCACSSSAAAHSLPERFDPRPGAVLASGPAEVRIAFDGDIEPAFSSIAVTDAAGRRVDKGDTRVDRRNPRLLRVGLGALRPGPYVITWQVLAIDGHRKEGTYTFTIRAAE